ncbi:hypothetical protein RE432_11390 [Pusillimonas sp. SM2304]|uniref:hypothetical protein n=1 Tax=Pusillimonas sp. SM2304 TaxID=3073241 RepID=UPI00287572B7|nr:hypothetical protein [Pusillimonas sp. SM2304]MDS1141039.1 hypothetical protein [Pusillimonas sp. SM2304]
MDSDNLRLAYKIETDTITGITVNTTHPASAPVPVLGDHIFLAPEAHLADTYTVKSRNFIYSNRGVLIGVELTVGARG